MNLLSSQSQGAVWLVVIFAICFIVVHGIKLALLGYRSLGKKQQTEPEKKAEPKPSKPAKVPEPVYYIVEKKKKKPKVSYSEPKEIRFE